MGKTQLKHALIVLIAAQTVITIGCGDGGAKPRRQPIKRSGGNLQKGGAQNPNLPTTAGRPGLQNPQNGTNGSPNNSGLPVQNDTHVKSEKMNRMKAELDQRSAGGAITAQQLEEGLYSLEEVASHFVYQDSSRGDDVEILNVYANNSLQLSKTGGDSVGVISNGMDSGRQIIVPYKFYVKGFNGQPWQPKRDQSVSEVILKTYAEIKPGAMALNDSFQNGADVVREISVMEALGTPAGQIDGETAYESADHTGKKVHLRLRKANDGKLKLVISVLEQGNNSNEANTAESKYMKRTLVLTFSRQGLPGNAGNDKAAAPAPSTDLNNPFAQSPIADSATKPTQGLPVQVE